jgi:hypothetical protein
MARLARCTAAPHAIKRVRLIAYLTARALAQQASDERDQCGAVKDVEPGIEGLGGHRGSSCERPHEVRLTEWKLSAAWGHLSERNENETRLVPRRMSVEHLLAGHKAPSLKPGLVLLKASCGVERQS